MGRQESPQLIERKTQVDTDAQETSRASKYNVAAVSFRAFSSRTVLFRIFIFFFGSTLFRFLSIPSRCSPTIIFQTSVFVLASMPI